MRLEKGRWGGIGRYEVKEYPSKGRRGRLQRESSKDVGGRC